jgi:hypothetical protein
MLVFKGLYPDDHSNQLIPGLQGNRIIDNYISEHKDNISLNNLKNYIKNNSLHIIIHLHICSKKLLCKFLNRLC